MTFKLFGIPNCDTMKRARCWLDSRNVDYSFHDYKKVGIDAETLNRWADKVGWEPLLNRTGTTFRNLAEADRLDVDRDKAIRLMVAYPAMIKRPVLEGLGLIRVGFKPETWNLSFG